MIERWLFFATLITALGSGLIAGAFFAFSTFVMKALSRLPASQGIAAMQSINLVVINPWFLVVFLGTALICLLLAGSSVLRWHQPGAAWVLAGGLLYVVGTFGVTILFNVPQNNTLAALDPASADAAAQWASYVKSWSAWNHVRTVAALAASAAFIFALLSAARR